MIPLAVVAYAVALVVANLLVVRFGPAVTPLNAFVLIGLDLTLRDWLHVRVKPLHMLGLIASTGALTYLLNPASGIIAIASAVSFTAASGVDWAVFSRVNGSWATRANTSNVAGSAVDSILFPAIAFGAIMPGIVAAQFVAKVMGGAVWTWAFSKAFRRETA